MTGDNVIPFLPRETSEADAVAIAERVVAPQDRLFAARVALARIDRYADGRRAVLRYCLCLEEQQLATLGGRPANGTTPLLHDADECPPASRIIRSRAVLRSLSKEGQTRPQAPKLALAYVRRLLELEMAEPGGGSMSR